MKTLNLKANKADSFYEGQKNDVPKNDAIYIDAGFVASKNENEFIT